MRKRIFLLHCFPTPYRNHLFKALYDEAQKRDIDFQVHFFSGFDESRPNWIFKSASLEYSNLIWKPIFKIGPVLHLNCDLLKFIWDSKPNLIILGGIWTSINSMFLSWFSKIQLIGWDETNRFDNKLVKKRRNLQPNFENASEIKVYRFNPNPHIKKKFFKRSLLKRISYLTITGLESANYYNDLLLGSASEKKFIYFPNLIDEKLFAKDLVSPTELIQIGIFLKLPKHRRIAYWPARFIPHKGILNFLDHVDKSEIEDWVILLVGQGEMKITISEYIREKKLVNHVRIIDELPYSKARLLYFHSELFIMPSLSDSNPLSVVEAIHSSLPILVSNRIGNLHEVLVEGVNGASLDPFSSESIAYSSKLMFSKTKQELTQMGQESKKLALRNFDTQRIVTDFFDVLQYKYKLI